MPTSGVATYAWVRFWNTTTNTPAINQQGNLTLKLDMDGQAAATLGAAVQRGDGWYRVLVTGEQNTGARAQVYGWCSTPGVVMVTGDAWDNSPSAGEIAQAVLGAETQGLEPGTLGGDARRARIIVANPYTATDDGNQIEFEDDDQSIATTHTYSEIVGGHERTVS